MERVFIFFLSKRGTIGRFCGLAILFGGVLVAASPELAFAGSPDSGLASWYGEAHRGKLMANGKKFDPDKLTAASWFYPLGTRVRVTIQSPEARVRSVLVTITDRGPAQRLVRSGRIIDLSQAAFRRVAPPELGLVEVTVEPLKPESGPSRPAGSPETTEPPALTPFQVDTEAHTPASPGPC